MKKLFATALLGMAVMTSEVYAQNDQQRYNDAQAQIKTLQGDIDSLVTKLTDVNAQTRKIAIQSQGLLTAQPTAQPTEPPDWKDNIPIYLMTAISLLAVIALAVVIIYNGRSKPKYVMPPPWMMPPPKKKKVKKVKKVKKAKSEKDDKGQSDTSEPPVTPVTPVTPDTPDTPVTPVQPPPLQTPPEPVMETEEDTAVMQSEIRSARQSVVSMSVGQPNTATTIVREWLEQEAPAPTEATEATEAAESAPSEPEPEAEEEKGKKKKKKKKKK